MDRSSASRTSVVATHRRSYACASVRTGGAGVQRALSLLRTGIGSAQSVQLRSHQPTAKRKARVGIDTYVKSMVLHPAQSSANDASQEHFRQAGRCSAAVAERGVEQKLDDVSSTVRLDARLRADKSRRSRLSGRTRVGSHLHRIAHVAIRSSTHILKLDFEYLIVSTGCR